MKKEPGIFNGRKKDHLNQVENKKMKMNWLNKVKPFTRMENIVNLLHVNCFTRRCSVAYSTWK